MMESPQKNLVQVQRDFFVDTKGYCFLCLSVSVTALTVPQLSSSSVYSFQHISHYLQMSKRAAFSEKVPIPQHLLLKVERSKLKVSLCQRCGSQVELFSQLYQQLERIQMEVNSCLMVIHGKMVKAEEAGRVEEFRRLGERERMDFEKINIAQRVRKEAFVKCVSKLRKAIPRVRLAKPSDSRKVTKAKDTDGGVNHSLQAAKHIQERKIKSGSPFKGDIQIDARPHSPAPDKDLSDYPDISISSLLADVNTKYPCPSAPAASASPDVIPESATKFRKILPKPTDSLLRNILTSTTTATTTTSATTNSQSNPQLQLQIIPTKKFKLSKGPTSRNSSDSQAGLKCVCNLCGKVFQSQRSLKRHYESIHLNLRHFCDLCSKSFSQVSGLNMHKRKDHDQGIQKPSQPAYQCGRCSRRYESKWRMDNHLIASTECARHQYLVISLDTPESGGEVGGNGGVKILSEESDQMAMDADVDPLSGLGNYW